jgi:cysteine-rich repeat protein
VTLTGAVASGCSLSESGLECDDDIDNDRDGRIDCADPGCFLEPHCQPCGDGRLDEDEACDDGNLVDGDGCSSRCLKEGCPNGELDPGEECDDGNLEPGDGCNFRCEIDLCGNGRFDPGEECDDGNALSGDGCSARCRIERGGGASCGNGRFDPGEQCDDGNRVSGDGCSAECRAEFCGDGIRQPRLGEACDGPDTPEGARCEGCRIVRCGNGIVEPELGEECDDGNRFFGDGCNPACRIERCGDGFLSAGEQCDDSNTISGDGCSAECQVERCGDGIVQRRLGELCDEPGPDCVGCRPRRVCSDGLCFRTSFQQLGLFPSGATMTRGATPFAMVGGRNFADLFVYPIDAASGLSPGTFRGVSVFVGITALTAGEVLVEGDGDEVIIGLGDGRVGRTLAGGTVFTTLFSTGGAPLDIALDDAAAVSHIAALGRRSVTIAQRAGNAFSASSIEAQGGRRVVFAPVNPGGVGVVLARDDGLVAYGLGAQGVELLGFLPLDVNLLDIAAADVDDDGVPDLVVLAGAPDELHAVLLDGATRGLPSSLVFLAEAPGGDFVERAALDGDGRDDLVVGSRFGSVGLHLAARGYQRGALLPAPGNIVRPSVVDIDGDGDVDIFVAGASSFAAEAMLYLRE